MKKQQKTVAMWLLIIVATIFVMQQLSGPKASPSKIKYADFISAVEQGKVKEVYLQGNNKIQGSFVEGYEADPSLKNVKASVFETIGNTGDETFKILRKHGITPNYKEVEKPSITGQMLMSWGPMIILFVIFFIFLRQLQGGGGKAMSFGKSKAKMLNESSKKVTFSDVSGVEEAKEELVEVVDFLKEPKKYTKLGGKIPKGVLLVGPPGTGKTLLARAVAGEAGVPFFSISGSDFVEMFVGVGASRVRDLFEQGKKNAPCIIFIDEIDAVGRHRGQGMGGGHDEREQTLNQMLVEMDGFESNEGVIIMAATNRVDVLDPALLRPGRFDRRVTVGRPDVRGRLGILKVHTKNSPLCEDINLEIIAKGTPGFTGADLANLVNEAALLAARESKSELAMIDFENAKDKVLMGVARKSMVISDEEKKNTAYHEAGHAIVGLMLPNTDPIHKVSIIPRGGALGVTVTLPEEDRLSMSKKRANNEIAMLLGGRIAEELTFDDFTAGAANDIERATQMAKHMVTSWGMSELLGTVNFGQNQSSPFGHGPGADNSSYSDETAKRIDDEVSKIIRRNYEVAKKILSDKQDRLVALSESLILWETLDGAQINRIMDGEDIGMPMITETKKPEKKEEPKEDTTDESSSTLKVDPNSNLSPA